MSLLDWFKKPVIQAKEPSFDFEDGMENALWDIKEKYDLETEEVERAVFEKRKNLNYMNQHTKNKK